MRDWWVWALSRHRGGVRLSDPEADELENNIYFWNIDFFFFFFYPSCKKEYARGETQDVTQPLSSGLQSARWQPSAPSIDGGR